MPEINVGQRIRFFRKQHQLSLRGLAEKCELSVNAISRIERGEASPTVSSLHQLAAALGVSIIDFFQPQRDVIAVFVKGDERLVVERNTSTIEILASGFPNQQLEPFLVTIQPHTGNLNDPLKHHGQEFIFCLEGEVEYHIAEQVFHLGTGDSLLYEARQVHAYYNPTDDLARLLIVYQGLDSDGTGYQSHL